MQILNVEELQHRQLQSKTSGEKYSLSALMSSIYKFENLFIHHEILPPNHKASAPHTHSHMEEMIFVLKGHPTVHFDNKTVQLKPGDFIGFKPETGMHYVENLTNFEAHILVICSNPNNDQIKYS